MEQQKTEGMTGRRALLTDRDREVLGGEADITDEHLHQFVSRLRNHRFENLEQDMEVLEQYPSSKDGHETLADEVRERICDTDE